MRILVYTPDADEAAFYAEALRQQYRAGVQVDTASTPAEAEPLLPQAEAMAVWRLPPALYRHARHLEWIHCLGAGVDEVLEGYHLLIEADPSRTGIPVTNTRNPYPDRIAEYVAGFILAETLQLPRLLEARRQRRWDPSLVPGRLQGRVVGIAGVGTIGSRVAEVLHHLGARVMGWKRNPWPPEPFPALEQRLVGRAGFDTLLQVSDFLVITLPRTSETLGLVGYAELCRMKPTARLINVGRGGIVDETALLRALQEGRIGGAVLDVFATEPLPPDHPLWEVPQVTITPHISGHTVPKEALPELVENVGRFLRGEVLQNQVDVGLGY